MKKAFLIALSILLLLASATTVFGAEYKDLKSGSWAHDAVAVMSEKAIVKGYPDGSFKPDNQVTYGEFVKMSLIAATGEDTGNSPEGHWAEKYYAKALELKYFTGYDIDKSQLGDSIDRAHMALIISSILGDTEINDYDEIQKGIEDINAKTECEYDITKAYASGILTGYPDHTFQPQKTLTRAEAAMVIYRLMDDSKRVIPGAEPEPEKTTAERLLGESSSGTVNLAESSTSTLLLDDLVTNRASFRLLNNVTYYEIVKDYPYTMSKWKDLLGVECLVFSNKDNSRGAFIINDKKLTMLEDTGGYIYQVAGVTAASSFPDFDFIGFYNMDCDTMALVPNPFQ